ncbi:MAG: UMP kinase [Abditibacteriota bacterium]|nr:UMP kinase [Abditibacteriota bacterium]
MAPVYKRILLKLSGEAFAGPDKAGINGETVRRIALEVKKAHETRVQIGVVIGAGNLVRGATVAGQGVDRTDGDLMGMLGTVMNSMALQAQLENLGVPARVMSSLDMTRVCEPFIKKKAVRHLEKGRVVIFGGGTGNPYFTTDTAAALKALETDADVLFKATNVDGVYTADPKKDPSAVKYDSLSCAEALEKGLKVMDSTAFSMCRDNRLPILVFDIKGDDNIKNAVLGNKVGTYVGE